MSDVARKNSAFFSPQLGILKHPRFMSVMLAIAAIWLIYILSVPPRESLRLTALAGPAETQNELHVHTPKAFSFLEASQALSSEEYEARAIYIIAQLKRIRDDLDADNVFVFSFHPDSEQTGDFQEQLVSNTFEVNRGDVSPHLYLLQDLSSYAWEHVRNAQIGVYIASGADGYGMQLYNRQHTAIGFLGASSLKRSDDLFTVDQVAFEELARHVEIALSYPLEDFQKLQAD